MLALLFSMRRTAALKSWTVNASPSRLTAVGHRYCKERKTKVSYPSRGAKKRGKSSYQVGSLVTCSRREKFNWEEGSNLQDVFRERVQVAAPTMLLHNLLYNNCSS